MEGVEDGPGVVELIRRRLYDFYDTAARADTEETTRLARTIQTWWPAVLVALTENVTNARTEGFNRMKRLRFSAVPIRGAALG